MTCERHGGGSGSIMCRFCDAETIEREDAMTTPTPTGIEEMKREHDALILKGRPLMEELEAMTVRVNEIRKLIEEADPDEYDGVRLLFAGTFYD